MDSGAVEVLSNKFHWNEYAAPRSPQHIDAAAVPVTASDALVLDDEEEQRFDEKGEDIAASSPTTNDGLSFTIRHLKQGATGAVKTWPVAEVLLEYLVQRGGLLQATRGEEPLDLTVAASPHRPQQTRRRLDSPALPSQKHGTIGPASPPCYSIVELGSGSGYLGIGLSLSLNREACRRTVEDGVPFQPRVKVMCTDNDGATIKNLRHNVSRQPRDSYVSKAVRVVPLGWNDDVGGEKFSEAVRLQFREPAPSKKKIRFDGPVSKDASACTSKMHQPQQPQGVTNDEDATLTTRSSDPIRLLTHLVASDVHYGVATLEPLSSVVSAVKLRNPAVSVILMLKERNPDSVAHLKTQIEAKVNKGLELESRLLQSDEDGQELPSIHSCTTDMEMLQGFSVNVRDVLHNNVSGMKLLEC